MPKNRPKWEQKMPKIQALVINFFYNPWKTWEKCREIYQNANKK